MAWSAPLFTADCALVGADDGTIDEGHGFRLLCCQGIENVAPEPGPGPPVDAAADRGAGVIALRQIAPRRAGCRISRSAPTVVDPRGLFGDSGSMIRHSAITQIKLGHDPPSVLPAVNHRTTGSGITV